MRDMIDSDEWLPLSEVVREINKNIMPNNPKFVLGNWDCKYINIRVDMRTGMALVKPGNKSGMLQEDL